ncbi:MAG: hypothetical protein KAV68_00610 [Dehalococcoidales bacterium]|nr:hypothetical protein [Dehalococcoidales bacterium]
MDGKSLLNLLSSIFIEKLGVSQRGEGYKINLPFTDNAGESIEVYVEIKGDEIVVDDLGHTAGLLFQLGQHGHDTIGHQFTRNVAEAYGAIMDYDRGVLFKSVSIQEPGEILDFIQLLTTLKSALPEIRYRKRVRKTGRRLVALMSREIKQLKLPLYVQRQTEVEGRSEIWTVDFRYTVKLNGQSTDVIIVAADLKWGEPREKAAHALTLAVDVLSLKKTRELRIVYDLGKNGDGLSVQRAARLIEDYQEDIGYIAYNYGDKDIKSKLVTQINQELTPYLFKQGT